MTDQPVTDNKGFQSGYAEVNGLQMYYEIYGSGRPLVLLHGGGSTIETSFGRLIPLLAPKRQIIAIELQAHGRTGDRPAHLSFEQDADDVAALLAHLQVPQADFLGFSNGGQTLIELALRHPQLVRRLIIASAFYSREAAAAQFWEGFENATLNDMPVVLRDSFMSVNNAAALQNMFEKDVHRMKTFRGWSREQVQSIAAPTLIINATADVGSIEHAVEMYRAIPGAELAIFPGLHGAYIGALEVLEDGRMPGFNAAPLIASFLDKD